MHGDRQGILGVAVQIFGTCRNLYTSIGVSSSSDVLFLHCSCMYHWHLLLFSSLVLRSDFKY